MSTSQSGHGNLVAPSRERLSTQTPSDGVPGTLAWAPQEFEERVKKLERQNRMWKIGGLAAIIALAASITATAWAQQRNAMPFRTPTVEAEHFILKDAGGATRGEFTVTSSGPVLQLFGPDGRVVWSTQGGARPATDGQ